MAHQAEASRRTDVVLIWEMAFGMVFTFFLKDNVHIVIAIEINESKFRMFRIAWKAIL